MTARTVVTPLSLVKDSSVAQGSSFTVDAVNGNVILAPGPWKILLVVTNGDSSSHTCTIRATGNGVNAAGSSQTSPAPSNTVFTQSTLGDLVVTVTNGTTRIIGPFTLDRYAQTDGSMSIDWSASTSMTAWAYLLPYNAI